MTKTMKMTNWIQLIAGIVALLTAIIMLIVTLKNDKPNSKHEAKGKNGIIKLSDLHKKIDLSITAPVDGTIITLPVIEAKGTISGDLPHGYRLYILLKDKTNYFLQYPAVEILSSQKKWSHGNINPTSDGEWRVLVCIASQDAVKEFEGRARRSDWAGRPNLPTGAMVMQSVIISKTSKND